MNTVLEAILPLKLSGGWQGFDLDRSKILLRSLSRFWNGSQPLHVTIVASNNDLHTIKSELHSDVLDIGFVEETDLLPCLRSMDDVPGWYKQQVLKLAAHKVVAAPFYLLLDADVICTKAFSEESLIINGKALTDWESRNMHPDWWKASAKILNVDEQPELPGMSVTPETLSKDICALLEAYLQETHAQNGWEYLLKERNWTEYSLYSTFALSQSLMLRYHHPIEWMTQNNVALRSSHCVWGLDGVDSWTPACAFTPNSKGFFIVFQSNTRVPPASIYSRISEFF